MDSQVIWAWDNNDISSQRAFKVLHYRKLFQDSNGLGERDYGHDWYELRCARGKGRGLRAGVRRFHRIRLQFAAVIFTFASLLAIFPTANVLLGVIKGGEEAVFAKGTLSAGRLHAPYI